MPSPPRRLRRWAITVLVLAVAGLALLAASAWLVGSLLSQPQHRVIGDPPADWPARSISVPTDTGGVVNGWMATGQAGQGTVLLLHGVHADRLAMLARARWLHQRGFSVLLIDLPAHGESSGARISFGMAEGAGVRAAMAYLRRSVPGEKIGVIGASLGGAAMLLAQATPQADAVVLESVFPSIAQAVDNRVRLRLGPLADVVTPLLVQQLPWRLQLQPAQLRPIDHIAQLGAPVLVAGGTQDQHTTAAETQQLFAAAQAPKTLWMVEGAGHVDLYRYAPQAYEAQVLGFLSRYLVKDSQINSKLH